MSEHSKHTRGPWVAVEIGQGGPADAPMPIYEIRSADNRAVIAEFVDGNNAALLAAAPDLLEALKLMVAWYGRRELGDTDSLLSIDEQNHEIQNAMRAIAKAEAA